MKFYDWLPVYGDTSFRGDCPQEAAEQVTFFSQLRKRHPALADVALHPRNEGKRTAQQAQRHKAEGMNTGASDVVIPGCPSLIIEIKRRDHTESKWQPGQIEYLEACKARGCVVAVALGWEAAMEAVEAYVKNNPCPSAQDI